MNQKASCRLSSNMLKKWELTLTKVSSLKSVFMLNEFEVQIDGLDQKDNTAKEIKKKLSEHTRSQINAKMPSQKVQEAKKVVFETHAHKQVCRRNFLRKLKRS